MITKEILMKFGFAKDVDNLKLKEIFKNDSHLKDIHIEIFSENPLVTPSKSFMLLLKTIEKNVAVLNDDNRIVLKKNDEYQTYLMNILFSEIMECYFKVEESYSEFILNIQNIYYRINI